MSCCNVEIVGLRSGDNGCNCAVHAVCGQCVKLNSLLRLKRCVIEVDDYPQEAVKAVLVEDGVDMCTVAFVPRAHITSPNVVCCLLGSKFVQVIEIYYNSTGTYKKQKDGENMGMAACILLEDIDEAE